MADIGSLFSRPRWLRRQVAYHFDENTAQPVAVHQETAHQEDLPTRHAKMDLSIKRAKVWFIYTFGFCVVAFTIFGGIDWVNSAFGQDQNGMSAPPANTPGSSRAAVVASPSLVSDQFGTSWYTPTPVHVIVDEILSPVMMITPTDTPIPPQTPVPTETPDPNATATMSTCNPNGSSPHGRYCMPPTPTETPPAPTATPLPCGDAWASYRDSYDPCDSQSIHNPTPTPTVQATRTAAKVTSTSATAYPPRRITSP